MIQHKHYLLQALAEAEMSRGFCAPNPSVGSLIVKNHKIIASGYHRGIGQPHAEVEALKKLGEAARGATLYVSLEPCCHHGRTPPCTQLIIECGISAVYYGYQDPNPLVAGKGEAELKQAGIHCEQIDSEEIKAFYESYAHWINTKRPWVTAKIALSLDAKIAGPQGQTVQITGEELQQFTHQWRKRSDAILTTAKTIINDNPQLNARMQNQVYAKPLYILDRRLDIPNTAEIFKTAKRITIFHEGNLKKPLEKNAEITYQPVTSKNNKLDLAEIIAAIGSDGVHDLWVEAGGQLFEGLITEKQIQRSFIYIAAKHLGVAAQPAFSVTENLFADVREVNWQIKGKDALCEMLF
jgi:diaminohydroxyphosphoribosylaminopyrimidine deaminase/5-amino-6-(5-phosphoribosylamino)uracil reductase